MSKNLRLNVYSYEGKWFYSAWFDNVFDHTDELDAGSLAAARAEAESLPFASALRRDGWKVDIAYYQLED